MDKEYLSDLKRIIGCIDLTTLEGTDHYQTIMQLCNKAKSVKNLEKNIPAVAAVCVYPVFVNLANDILSGSGIGIASVAGGFPSGQTFQDIKVAEVQYALQEGADEIDMVISRGKLLEGDYDTVSEEIVRIKEVCGSKHVKVILETGELKTKENVKKASEIAIRAGADFIKTSTGKIAKGADKDSFRIMLEAIKSNYVENGFKVGIKAAGGISDPQMAYEFYLMVSEILGQQWLSKEYFRIGASRLLGKILEQLDD